MIPEAVSGAEAVLGKRARRFRIPSGGHSPAARLLVEFDDGSSCFVKAATEGRSAEWLRIEHRLIYSQVVASFVPRVLGWADGDRPLLILEDLSDGSWPPPWTTKRVEQVLQTLEEVHRTHVEGLPTVTPVQGRDLEKGWRTVQANPGPFLALGLCSPAWLSRALPALIGGASKVQIEGDDLVHYDVRGDNLCFVDDRVVLIDWNWAVRGSGLLDVAFWLPSLVAEGGARPEHLAPDSPEWAALLSGYYAARATIPQVPETTEVRHRQLDWLKAMLPWAVCELDLPPLDGPVARHDDTSR